MSYQRPITRGRIPAEFIHQKQWTDEELRQMGYTYFDRRKQLVMARTLSPAEAPLTIQTSWGDTLSAEAGYRICYEPAPEVHERLADYEHWPVAPDIFDKTYRPWDEPDWQPSPGEKHLMALGCEPFYKVSGIWAKKLDEDAYLLSLEHEKPVKVKTGTVVAIGAEGEPYAIGEDTLHDRYTEQRLQRGWLARLRYRLRRWFGGG